MATQSGVNATLKYGGTAGTAFAEIGSWSLDIQRNQIDVSSFGDQWADNIAGKASWSVSTDGNWDIKTAASQQVNIQTAIINGTDVVLALYTQQHATHGTQAYYGTASVASMKVSTPFDDKVGVTFEFTGNGPITYTAL